MSCPVCASDDLAAFYARDNVPVLLNAPQVRRADAQAIPRGSLRLVACAACGFVHNAAFDEAKVTYATDYLNNQEHSPQFASYLSTVVARQGAHPGRVLEIGCGKGAFLRHLCATSGATGWGYDTTYVGPPRVGGVQFSSERYAGNEVFDRVIARHVLEHTPTPLALLRLARGSLDVGGHLFIEVPDLGWIVEHLAFWDLFHEHVGYFSPGSLAAAATRAGFTDVQVTPAFGGQYLWLEAVAGEASPPTPAGPGLALDGFAADVERLRGRWAERLVAWSGRAMLWGAGAKGVTFANLLDPEGRLLRGLIDIHPDKAGRFIPGSAHKVFRPDVLAAGHVDHVLVTNGNYLDEIRAVVATVAPSVTLHAL